VPCKESRLDARRVAKVARRHHEQIREVMFLLDISEAPLDLSVFELPGGYRQALHTGNGGADLTNADTISNRAQYCWTRLTFWVRGLFR